MLGMKCEWSTNNVYQQFRSVIWTQNRVDATCLRMAVLQVDISTYKWGVRMVR